MVKYFAKLSENNRDVHKIFKRGPKLRKNGAKSFLSLRYHLSV